MKRDTWHTALLNQFFSCAKYWNLFLCYLSMVNFLLFYSVFICFQIVKTDKQKQKLFFLPPKKSSKSIVEICSDNSGRCFFVFTSFLFVYRTTKHSLYNISTFYEQNIHMPFILKSSKYRYVVCIISIFMRTILSVWFQITMKTVLHF